MDYNWYHLTFNNTESFYIFFESFKAILINLDDNHDIKGNTIYLPQESNIEDFCNIYLSVNPENLDELNLILNKYKSVKIEKPDSIKYYYGNHPIV